MRRTLRRRPQNRFRPAGRALGGLTAAVTLLIGVAVTGAAAAAGTTPPKSGSAGAEPARAEPARAEPARAEPARAQAGAGARESATTERVLLITGTRLTTSPGGSLPRAGSDLSSLGGPLTQVRLNGASFELPADAAPYLGRGLDPRLFEVGSLTGRETGGRLPVLVTFSGSRPDLPGLTVTSAAAGRLSGYFTAASARRFGAALARQYAADHRDDRFGADGLFAGDVRIWLAGDHPAAAPATGQHFQMSTVTIRATDLQGKPDTGDSITVLGLNRPFPNPELEIEGFTFDHGSVTLSLPTGPYFAYASFDTRYAFHTVFLPQFSVHGQKTTITVAERSATSRILVSVPRRSTARVAGRRLPGGRPAAGVRRPGRQLGGAARRPSVHRRLEPVSAASRREHRDGRRGQLRGSDARGDQSR